MKKIDDNGFDLILGLCNLEVSSEDKQSKMNDIGNLLSWVDKLNQLDTTNVVPLVHLSSELTDLKDDTPSNPLCSKDVLQNAPSKNSSYILISNSKIKNRNK